jgi:hypothetical protein
LIALYVIGGILGLIVLLLFCSVTVIGSVNESVNIKIGYLFYHKTLIPEGENKKRKTAENDIKKPNKIREMIDKNGLVATIRELSGIVKVVLIRLKKTVKHIRVKKFRCVITVASDDPCKTAIEYGEVSGVAFTILRGLQELMKWNTRKTKMLVQSDFNGNKSKIDIEFKVKLKLYFILSAVLGVLFTLVKAKVTEILKNNDVKKGI